jgi:hypothetical protein
LLGEWTMRPLTISRTLALLSFTFLFALEGGAAGKKKQPPPPAPPPPAPAASEDPFSREAAAEALKGVDVGRCKVKNTPTGEGHVVVTFAPTGTAQDAVVDKGPFVGTKSEKCISKAYKGAKVPAFKGDPVSVGKTFKID